MVISAMGTDAERTLTEGTAKRQLEMRARFSVIASSSQDKRRFISVTYDILSEGFSGWKTFLVSNLFGTQEPTTLSDGQTAEMTMNAEAAGRITNYDETHRALSNAGGRSGSRANTQADPSPPTGSHPAANERHIMGLHGTTAAGKATPSLYFPDAH